MAEAWMQGIWDGCGARLFIDALSGRAHAAPPFGRRLRRRDGAAGRRSGGVGGVGKGVGAKGGEGATGRWGGAARGRPWRPLSHLPSPLAHLGLFAALLAPAPSATTRRGLPGAPPPAAAAAAAAATRAAAGSGSGRRAAVDAR